MGVRVKKLRILPRPVDYAETVREQELLRTLTSICVQKVGEVVIFGRLDGLNT